MFFIIIDFECDNGMVLKIYIEFFDLWIIGLIGLLVLICCVVENFKICYVKVCELGGDLVYYVVDYFVGMIFFGFDG